MCATAVALVAGRGLLGLMILLVWCVCVCVVCCCLVLFVVVMCLFVLLFVSVAASAIGMCVVSVAATTLVAGISTLTCCVIGYVAMFNQRVLVGLDVVDSMMLFSVFLFFSFVLLLLVLVCLFVVL